MWTAPVLLLLAAFATFDESYRAGLQSLAQNRLADAKMQLETAAGLEPGRSRVWLALARTYWKLHDSAKADDAAEKAAKLAASDEQVFQLLAVHYKESLQPLKACDMQVQYAALKADAAPAAIDCYLQANAPDRAIRAAASRWLDRADVRVLAARAYSATGQWPLAEAEFKEAIRLNPHEEAYRFDLANSLLQRQKFEQSILVLDAARKSFDKSPQLELASGVAFYGLRRFTEAADAFQRTIELAPELEQPYLFLGKILDQLPARLPQLTRLFETFEKAHPKSYVGYLVHAKALIAQQSFQDSEELLKQASLLNPSAAEPRFQLGVIRERQRQFPEAAAEFQAAAALDPNDAVTHYHLARIYDRLARPELAARERELHRRLLNASPDAAK